MNKVVSIFSGIDCLGLGFEIEDKFEIVLAVEKEKYACETLKLNKRYHKNLKVVNKEIETIEDSFIEQYKGVCGLIGGPPCPCWSNAKGKFDPTDERILTINEYLRWVSIIKPKFFLFENTSHILNKDRVQIFDFFISKLEKEGYKVNQKILNANDYGSVQMRERMIVVGIREDINVEYEYPKPSGEKKYVRDILKDEEVGLCKHFCPEHMKIVPYIPEGGHWRHLPNEELKKLALGVNYEKKEGGMTGMYKRLSMDGFCPTLTTSPDQKRTMIIHPTEDRPLSVKEYKRAQGIPEDYKILGGIGKQYKFIGNGVPVEMSIAIANSIYNALKKEYNSFEQNIS